MEEAATNVCLEHKLTSWHLLKKRACEMCKLPEDLLTTHCTGAPLERAWIMALTDGICDYVAGRWVDWTNRPVENALMLRQRETKYNLVQAAQGQRRPDLRRKMAMEDTLLQHQNWRGWNRSPFDD